MAELQRHLASSREAFQLVSQMLVTKHDAHAECKQVDMASQRREVQQAVAETRLRAQLARARADLKLVCEQLATSKEHGEARAEEERMAVERLLEDAIEGRWADRRRFKERQARSAVNLSLGLGLGLGLSPRPLHLRIGGDAGVGLTGRVQRAGRAPPEGPRYRRHGQGRERCAAGAPTRPLPPTFSPLSPLALSPFLPCSYYQPSSLALLPPLFALTQSSEPSTSPPHLSPPSPHPLAAFNPSRLTSHASRSPLNPHPLGETARAREGPKIP